MAKPIQKLKAIKLREKGKSIKNIASELNVSQGSVSLWTRGVTLTKKQLKRLSQNATDPYYGKRLDYIRSIQKKKNDKIARLLKKGIDEIGGLSRRELFLVGVSLYWAEGFKKDSQAGLATSDPKMARLFLKWLYECCGYKKSDLTIRVTVNASHKYRVRNIEKYWSKVTNISVSEFQKCFYQKNRWKKVYLEPEKYFGVVRIRVRKSTDFLRIIHGWIEGLKLLS